MSISYNLSNVGTYYPIQGMLLVQQQPCIVFEDERKIVSDWISMQQPIGTVRRLQIEFGNSVKPWKLHSYCIGIMLTNNCNLACKYCFSKAGDMAETQLSKDQIDTVINETIHNAQVHKALANRGFLTVDSDIEVELTISGGGEPTFHWEVFKYTIDTFKEKCSNAGLKSSVLLVTNAIQQGERIKYIIDRCDRINVSFDGTPTFQNAQRPLRNGDKSFLLVDNFIRQCEAAGKNLLIRSTVMGDNLNRIGEIADYVFDCYSNVNVVHIEPMISLGRAEKLKHIIGNDIAHEFALEYIKQSDRVAKKYPNKELFCTLFDYELKDYFCSAAVGAHPWVHPNGMLYPCKDELEDKYCIGVIKDTGIEFNKSFEALSMTTDKCKKCFAFYHCAGGCPRCIPKDVYGNCATKEALFHCSAVQTYWKEILKDAANGISHGRFVVEKIDDFPMNHLFKCIRISEASMT